MTTFAENLFLWDWSRKRLAGRVRHVATYASIGALLGLWIGQSARAFTQAAPIVWSVIGLSVLLCALYAGALGAMSFADNEAQFQRLLASGAKTPSTSPREQTSDVGRAIVLIAMVIAVLAPLIGPPLMGFVR